MIYFDNASTTKLSNKVLEIFNDVVENQYGNSSSKHFLGKEAYKLQEEGRLEIAKMLNCESSGIYFTSGATEASNIIIQGYSKYLLQTKSPRNEILISPIEHPCVANTAKAMESLGFQVHFLPVNGYGEICFDQLDSLLSSKTALVSVMSVNNEIGVHQDINKLARIVKSKSPETLFLTDVVQSVGKLPFTIDLSKVDSFFISGHKFGAPKGIGLFYLNEDYRILPTIFGGGQESSYRPGTNNSISVHLLKTALDDVLKDQYISYQYISNLNKKVTEELDNHKIIYRRIVPSDKSSPYILSIAILGHSADFLEAKLSDIGICVSTKSACSSQSHKQSRILSALQIDPLVANSTLRLSFSRENTQEEVAFFVRSLAKIIENSNAQNSV